MFQHTDPILRANTPSLCTLGNQVQLKMVTNPDPVTGTREYQVPTELRKDAKYNGVTE